jgi:hypothetical protein
LSEYYIQYNKLIKYNIYTKPRPGPSRVWRLQLGLGFEKDKAAQAKPKPGLSGQAGPEQHYESESSDDGVAGLGL